MLITVGGSVQCFAFGIEHSIFFLHGSCEHLNQTNQSYLDSDHSLSVPSAMAPAVRATADALVEI